MFLFLFFLSEIRKQEILKSFLKNLKKKKKHLISHLDEGCWWLWLFHLLNSTTGFSVEL